MPNPEIRFLDKNGSSYPDWSITQLSEFLVVQKKEKITSINGLKALTISLHCKGIRENTTVKVKISDSGRPYYHRYAGELIIGRQNFHNGSIAIVPKELDGGITSNAISSFQVIKINPIYLYLFLARESFYKPLGDMSAGTGQKEISEKKLLKLNISLPCLEEQERIAEFFTSLDNSIVHEEAKLKNIKNYKKSMLQKMFSESGNPEMRFTKDDGSDYGDWEFCKLGDVATLKAGGTPSTLKEIYWGGEIKWMNSGELNLRFVYDTQGRITEKGLKNSSATLLPPFCVLVGLAGQGKTRGTVAMNMVELCTNQSVIGILPNDTFNNKFVYYNLFLRYRELRLLSTGDGGRGGLNLSILNSLNMPLPQIEEQERIAEFFSSLDSQIDLHSKKLANLKKYKKSMLQKMFV